MTRVLVIESAGNLWGSERALLDLLDGLPDAAIAVCLPPNRPLQPELDRRHVRVLPRFAYALHEQSRLRRLVAAFGVLRACLAFRPDVIYLNQSGTYRVTLPAASFLRLPIIAHVRIFEDVTYLAQVKPKSQRLKAIVAISMAIRDEIRQFQALNSIAVHQIYDAYSESPEPAVAPLQASNRIACIGRIVPIKGQDVLIEALRLHGPLNIECLMVGNGETQYVQQLKDRSCTDSSGGSIQWLGFVSDVVPLLRTCAVLVCPSHREPLGRVIFEAWDAGAIPVVFSGSGGAAEVVRAAQGGILYDEQAPLSLANALRSAISLDQKQRAVLIDNGRKWMHENCDVKAYGKKISGIFSAAQARPPAQNGTVQR